MLLADRPDGSGVSGACKRSLLKPGPRVKKRKSAPCPPGGNVRFPSNFRLIPPRGQLNYLPYIKKYFLPNLQGWTPAVVVVLGFSSWLYVCIQASCSASSSSLCGGEPAPHRGLGCVLQCFYSWMRFWNESVFTDKIRNYCFCPCGRRLSPPAWACHVG